MQTRDKPLYHLPGKQLKISKILEIGVGVQVWEHNDNLRFQTVGH
jgi:hypothetical protein